MMQQRSKLSKRSEKSVSQLGLGEILPLLSGGAGMRELLKGTVTLLFTDIEGSTRLLHHLGKCYSDVLAECRGLMRAAFHQHHGHKVYTKGDAFFVTFTRATDAVMAAVAVQRSLDSHSWPDGVAVRVRMGLHTGEPERSTEGYVGLDVHRAARIMSAGHGGADSCIAETDSSGFIGRGGSVSMRRQFQPANF
jgi:class 3 adenylate cyclase